MRTAIFNRNPRLRAGLLSMLARVESVRATVGRTAERPRVQFLLAHSVKAVNMAQFRGIIERLARSYQIVSYSEAVRRVVCGPIDAPYLAFSFDDGFATCREAGDILASYGISACFFICPPIIGERDANKVRRFCEERLREPASNFLNWDEVEALRKAGHEIGSHTMTHPNLGQVKNGELEDEIFTSREHLIRRLGESNHFCWPFGHFDQMSAAAAQAVYRAGYLSCASGVRGCHVAPAGGQPDKVCLRRDEIREHWPLSHIEYFLLRNSRIATEATNHWPEGWQVEGEAYAASAI